MPRKISNNDTENSTSALMAKDISYIQKDIGEIKESLKDIGKVYISREEHQEVVDIQKDHETRTRSLEKMQVQIMTWGSAGVLALTIIQFFISKFVK